MCPNVITITTNVGFELKYESDRPLKADFISFLQDSVDALIEDATAYLSIGDREHAA